MKPRDCSSCEQRFVRIDWFAMTREEQAALVAWLRRPKAVWSAVTEQLEEDGSVRTAAAGALPAQETLFDVTPTDDVQKAAADLDRWSLSGIRMISVLDHEYPSNLRMIHQRPPVLFLRGASDERDATSVAVVGTRQATPQGIDQAKELAAGLAARGVPVISGLAAGIDTAAHTTALAAGGRHCRRYRHGYRPRISSAECCAAGGDRREGTGHLAVPARRTADEDLVPDAQCGDERVRARDGGHRGRVPEWCPRASAACAPAWPPCLPHAQPAAARLGARLRTASRRHHRGQRRPCL